MTYLGTRLEAALTLLKQCENNRLFADIGSDHAFLAIEVLKRNIAKNAIAADINKLPLEKGRENASLSGVVIDFILSDGFDSLEGTDLTSAAVCGMGGELIANMLIRSSIAKKCHLVLQPMSAQEELRKALWENGFEILTERFVIDAGKPYTVMLVKFTDMKTEFSYNDLYLGKKRENSVEFSAYCEKIRNMAEKRKLGIIARKESTAEIDGLISLCQTHITSV